MSIIGATTGIGADTSRLGSDKNLKAAGERFEAVFTGMMLKSMRKTKLAETLFESKAADQFRDMWDQKVAEGMAVSTPLGIGKAMTDFLGKAAATSTQAAPHSAVTPEEGTNG
ncbi:rod-binding protein [Sphingomonas silueang]|uniref:rod-binding protein n=1 Tax=Sphingomonas silueang TaxID=3156617 RepID=UPI0032B4EFF3